MHHHNNSSYHKISRHVMQKSRSLLGFYYITLNTHTHIYIHTHTLSHTQNNSPLFRKRKENYEKERVTPEFGGY
jgi:hypothetical protein